MKHDTRWVIVDTETDGLFAPIHVVEIAAQPMIGWEPCGEPFQVYLDHNVPIPAEATAVHGYTRAFLRDHGIDPRQAHARFAEFVGGAPLVCHNLGYDWDRALCPEWARLGCRPVGSAGFCTLLLARRVIHETSRHSLDTLKAHFRLTTGDSHRAAADVETVARLVKTVMAPRLTAAGIDTFDAVRAFTRRTPIRQCLAQIQGGEPCSPPTNARRGSPRRW